MIAWVFDSKKTGIGKYSKTAVDVLKKFLDIRAICEEKDFEKVLSSELVIYNIGNSKSSVKVYNLMRKKPGIVILHDRTYHNFFAYYYIEYLGRKDLYLKSLRTLYGEDVSKKAEDYLNRGNLFWESEDSLLYPMRELIYPYSKAIIVHLESFSKEIQKEYLGPILCVPFPFKIGKIRSKKVDFNKKLILLSYGFLGKNRMIDEVIKAIGMNKKIRERVIYVIAGYIEEPLKEELGRLISQYELEDTVKILGFVSDRRLKKLLSECFMCINLRRFSTEVVSGSIFEQINAERPVVVSNTGFFKEIPDNLVFKINSAEQLEEVLLKAITNPEDALIRAKKAKEYLKSIALIGSFRDKIVDFIKSGSYNKTIFTTEILKECSDAISSLSKELLSYTSEFIGEALNMFFI